MSHPQSPYGNQPANVGPYGAPPPFAQQPPQGHSPVYTAVFRKQTGMVFLAQTTRVQTTGTYPEVRSAFWQAQTHCLLLGWWGVLSLLLYNWVSLGQNMSTVSRIKKEARANGEL
ncbi:hypothetical protein [Gordonia sp. (in: high G+C Gram-positive bacteria)]|uniref:hypothetical protein n=1 Tax=Gordonia sp. (in: high G+C Gram-positive bacteria) TaxID=84139 RepID=UPI0025BE837C|nr:hypothetical protein [Gordonia sp. (in: high G+C Gram-positive bacteria)]